MLNKINKFINNAQIISFDIFNTLLFRPYINPEDMFLHLEKIHNCYGFAKERINAEAKFYSKYGTNKEATFDDIYNMLPNFKNMKNIEMNWEKQILRINPEIKLVYEYAIKLNKIIIITSDMYLPLGFIEKLLKKNNIIRYKKIYLSNKLNVRKDRGDMYKYIIRDLNTQPKLIFHIGDNRFSDYEQAKNNGLSAYLYHNNFDSFLKKNPNFLKLYRKHKNILSVSIINSLITQREYISNEYWVEFGYKYAGPIVYAYARWIYNLAVKIKLKKILFIARDGYLIHKVFNIFNKSIITEYIYAPRIVNYVTNLEYNTTDLEQSRIICEYFQKDIGDVRPDIFIKNNILEFKKLANKERKKVNYSKYIKKFVNSFTNIGVVDSITAQFSGQRLIEKEANIKTTGFYMVVLPESYNTSNHKYFKYFSNNLTTLFIKGYKCDLVELIFSSLEKPIITMKNGVPIYQESINKYENIRHEVYKKIEKGVMEFVYDIFKRFNNFDIYILPEVIESLLDIYVNNLNKEDHLALHLVRKSPYADNKYYAPLFDLPKPLYNKDNNKIY